MRDLLVNLASSVIAGVLVWAAQRAARYRRLERERAFFGLRADDECLLVVARHASSPHADSVHRTDVATLLELSALIKECGARSDLVPGDQAVDGPGRRTEFCVGGPTSNARTAAHLRWILPGVRFPTSERTPPELTIQVGDQVYRREPDGFEYVVLAKAVRAARDRPTFLLCGQTARTNHAAARYLTANYRRLARTYGVRGRFCLVLRIVDPRAYGNSVVELVGDVTATAFDPLPVPQGA